MTCKHDPIRCGVDAVPAAMVIRRQSWRPTALDDREILSAGLQPAGLRDVRRMFVVPLSTAPACRFVATLWDTDLSVVAYIDALSTLHRA
jgi:hypothetical protein